MIELLVVVLIIAILSAIALPQYRLAVLRVRSAEAISVLYSLVRAEQEYYLANGSFTEDKTALSVTLPPNGKIRYGAALSNDYARGAAYLEGYGMFFEKAFDPHDTTAWCAAYNELANRVCQTYGPYDHSGDDGAKYYLMN